MGTTPELYEEMVRAAQVRTPEERIADMRQLHDGMGPYVQVSANNNGVFKTAVENNNYEVANYIIGLSTFKPSKDLLDLPGLHETTRELLLEKMVNDLPATVSPSTSEARDHLIQKLAKPSCDKCGGKVSKF